MRKTLGVCLLVLLLTSSASAGIMGNDTPAPPPPQPTTAMQAPTDVTQEPTTAATVEDGTQDSLTPGTLTQIALDLLSVLPSLI